MVDVCRELNFVRTAPVAPERHTWPVSQKLFQVPFVHLVQSITFITVSRTLPEFFRHPSIAASQFFSQPRENHFDLPVCALGVSQVEQPGDLFKR